MAKKVLIVEDEVLTAMAMAVVIPAWGCQVVGTVTSGEEAIRIAEERRPDVVLMDINIEGPIDGLVAAREIIGRLGIPVIFMTGYDDDAIVGAAMELKPFALLVKPFEPSRLKALLQSDFQSIR